MNVLPFSGADDDQHYQNDYEDEGVFDFELWRFTPSSSNFHTHATAHALRFTFC
jgi:hypothetical protein